MKTKEMQMNQNLAQYIARQNFMSKLFGTPAIDPNNIKPADARRLLDSIEADLSPENLCCDGEISGAEVRRKAKFLAACQDALISGQY